MGGQRQARCICKNILAREEVERFWCLLVLCQGFGNFLILKNRKTVKKKRKRGDKINGLRGNLGNGKCAYSDALIFFYKIKIR
jgi:hypothetical protein